MHDSLDHLNDTQINALIDRYYNNEKISVLLTEYSIRCNPGNLFKLFPDYLADTDCPYCQISLVHKHLAKGDSNRYSQAICPKCDHAESDACTCFGCTHRERMQKKSEQERQREYLAMRLQINESEKVEFQTLSLKERVYLGALLREGISEHFDFISPLQAFINPLAPTQDYAFDITRALYRRKAIRVHPDNDLSVFTNVDPDAGTAEYNTFKVKWILNVQHEALPKVPLVEMIMNPLVEAEQEELYLLWKEIALHECLEYLLHSIEKIMQVEYTVGEKTTAIMNDLLNSYSVSQVYNLIYRATNNALRFQREKQVSMAQAANSIVGSALNYGEHAKVEGWNIQKYRREKTCPESALSKFFFERVLKIGYSGFDETPKMLADI